MKTLSRADYFLFLVTVNKNGTWVVFPKSKFMKAGCDRELATMLQCSLNTSVKSFFSLLKFMNRLRVLCNLCIVVPGKY